MYLASIEAYLSKTQNPITIEVALSPGTLLVPNFICCDAEHLQFPPHLHGAPYEDDRTEITERLTALMEGEAALVILIQRNVVQYWCG